MDKAEYLYDDPSVMFFAVGLLMLCDAGCSGLSYGRATHFITGIGGAGLGIYVLQVPSRALLRHLYQLGDPLINLVLVSVAYVVLLGVSLALGKVPGLRVLVRGIRLTITKQR